MSSNHNEYNVSPNNTDEKISSVFVYGTLKPSQRNHKIALNGGSFTTEECYIDGFDLYHFEPENYPGLLIGNGRVHGYALTYDDIDKALLSLDDLEGIHLNPPLYFRTSTICYPSGNKAWVYVYADESRCMKDTAKKIESGVWEPQSSEVGLYP
jgi:gamma-glutamylcyclotransferase (GGCT)/AIG2-like uncharacterized protein YtfP